MVVEGSAPVMEKLPIDTGDPETCGPCDWFGKPGVRHNDDRGEPTGPLAETQRCPNCDELVCNRHLRPDQLRDEHFVAAHGEPLPQFQ